jgi:prepilin-type N-terminal cleavage/methylation domain-containing protein
MKTALPIKGFTMIEILIVLAIIVILAGILFPVFALSRERARQSACLSNLRQMGFALIAYRSDNDEVNAHYRWCDTSYIDPVSHQHVHADCSDLSTPTAYTGSAEEWWAPYDNSVAPDSTGPYPHYKIGFLQPYIKSTKIFKCPSDMSWQVGYAMSYIWNGPMGQPDAKVSNLSVFFIWDHAKTPGCADTTASAIPGHRGPFPFSKDTAHTHYPDRHNGNFVGVCYDGHAKTSSPARLHTSDFAAF